MKNEIKTIPYYKGKDQFIASTLYALGEKLDSTERVGNELFFVFENGARCQEIVKQYYNDDLRLSPRVLFAAFKDIKSIIFNN